MLHAKCEEGLGQFPAEVGMRRQFFNGTRIDRDPVYGQRIEDQEFLQGRDLIRLVLKDGYFTMLRA